MHETHSLYIEGESLVTGNEERWRVPCSQNFVPKRGTGTNGNTPRNARGTSFIEDRNAYLEEVAPPRYAAAVVRPPCLDAGTMHRLAATLGRCVALGRCRRRPAAALPSSGRRAGTLPLPPSSSAAALGINWGRGID
jgi:hypothetical protein